MSLVAYGLTRRRTGTGGTFVAVGDATLADNLLDAILNRQDSMAELPDDLAATLLDTGVQVSLTDANLGVDLNDGNIDAQRTCD